MPSSRQNTQEDSTVYTNFDLHPYLARLLLFCSGFAAISYEIIWQRQLGLIVGNTVYATSIVLAAFMIGHAGGSYIAGKVATRAHKPLQLFFLIEVFIGIFGIAIPFCFPMVRNLYRFIYLTIPDWIPLLISFRVFTVLGILLIPTLLMGATLPLICEGLVPDKGRFRKQLGFLYGANTLGAVFGVLVCGFFLIPSFGLILTNSLAVTINFLVATVSFILWKDFKAHPRFENNSKASLKKDIKSGKTKIWLIASAAYAGFTALGLEILWFRGLTMINGSAVYSFSSMLSVFLIGIVIGSMAMNYITNKKNLSILFVPLLFALIGIYTLFSTSCFVKIPSIYIHTIAELELTWNTFLLMNFFTAVFILFVPTFFFGALFTFLTQEMRSQTHHSSSSIGSLYAINTTAGAFGALVTGLIFLPIFGLEKSLLGCALGILLFSCLLAYKLLPNDWHYAKFIAVISLVTCIFFTVTPRWEKHSLWFSPYYRASTSIVGRQVYLKDRLSKLETLYLHEGFHSTVAVTKDHNQVMTYICDGKIEADTTSSSMALQLMIAHIPMLLHDSPLKNLNIGLGTGITTGAIACYPVESIKVVEIEEATTEVAKFFTPWNENILNDSRFDMHVDDARNYLFVTDQLYDTIISDPIEPVVSGSGPLFTYEHFELMSSRLNPNGLAAQFLPLYDSSKNEFMLIMRSFARAFPNSLLFYTGTDTILLGYKGDITLNTTSLEGKLSLPKVRHSLQTISIDSTEDIIGMLITDLTKHEDFTDPGPLNTDSHPIVEFHAPRNVFYSDYHDCLEDILLTYFSDIPTSLETSLASSSLAKIATNREAIKMSLQAQVMDKNGQRDSAEEQILQAVALVSNNKIVLNVLVKIINKNGEYLVAQRKFNDAYQKFRKLIEYDPKEPNALFRISEHLLNTKQFPKASHWINTALGHYPDSIRLIHLRAKLKFQTNDYEGAISDYEYLINRAPKKVKYLKNYYLLLNRLGRTSEAAKIENRLRRLEEL
ncbi:MAG: fused MFS/spermidine synthase [Verrucomicrobiota bacterium]